MEVEKINDNPEILNFGDLLFNDVAVTFYGKH